MVEVGELELIRSFWVEEVEALTYVTKLVEAFGLENVL